MKNEIEGYKIRKWYEFFEETLFNPVSYTHLTLPTIGYV